MSPIITFTTDLGTKDYYSAAIKGKILCHVPSANLVDISHHANQFDPFHGALILNQSFRFFPNNTIHLLFVGNSGKEKFPLLIAKYQQHYFVGFDNGSFSRIFDVAPDWVHTIDIESLEFANSFSVIHSIGGILKTFVDSNFDEIPGSKKADIFRRQSLGGYATPDMINGVITYIDSFENAITDIHREQFFNVGKNRAFTLHLKQYTVNKINKFYDEYSSTDLIVLFNNLGFLELSLNKAKAASLLNLKINDNIKIHFDD
jgi:S-adenosyl-L-methionine hydrolase (adenosine-forming)